MVNWSHFKPEFAGKPEEDAETHLPCTNYWMRTHNFSEENKVQRFCLTLLGEVRLWYKTLSPLLMTGQLSRMLLGDSIPNWAIPQSNTSTNGKVFILMKMWTALTHMSQGSVNAL